MPGACSTRFAEDARLDIAGISGVERRRNQRRGLCRRPRRRRPRRGRARGSNSSGSRSRPKGSLAPAQRKLLDAWLGPWGRVWPGTQWAVSWAEAVSQFVSPYAFNPLNVNPVRDHLVAAVDFERLRASDNLKLFVAATNVRTGRGEIFRRNVLTADHVMASACLPTLFQAVRIDGDYYWDGGYAGNPPLWPLFYETRCRDVVIVQINPIERDRGSPHAGRDPEPAERDHLQLALARGAPRRRLRRPPHPLRHPEERGLQARAPAPDRRRGPARALSTPRPNSTSPGPSSRNCATSAAPTPRLGSRRISTRSASRARSTSTRR